MPRAPSAMPTTDASDSCSDRSASSQRAAGQQHQRRRRDGRRRRRAPTDQVRAHADRQHQRRPQRRDRLAGHQREQRDRRAAPPRPPPRADRRRAATAGTRAAADRTTKNSSAATAARCSPDTDRTCVAPATRKPSSTSGPMPRRSPSTAVLRNAAASPRTSRSIAARSARRTRKAIRRGTAAGRLGEARDRAGVGDARQRIDAGRAHRQRRIGKAWVAGAVQLVEARPEGDPLAGPEIGPAVDDGQRQRARRRRARDPRQRDDQAGARAGALRPARDRPLDLLGVVALARRRQRGIQPGGPQRRAFPAARPARRTRRGRRPPPAGRARARSPPPRSARTRRPSASRARQPARRHRPRRRRCTTRRAARVMFGAARVRLPRGPSIPDRRDQYQLMPTMKARLLRSPPSVEGVARADLQIQRPVVRLHDLDAGRAGDRAAVSSSYGKPDRS